MKKFIIIAIVLFIATFWLFISDSKEVGTQNNFEQTSENISEVKNDKELEGMFEETVSETSFGKIDEAFESEEITLDQRYAYKLVSMFDGELLPEKYAVANLDHMAGDRILMMIQEDWDKLAPETQEILAPVLLPFSDEDSFFFYENYELRNTIISQLAQF